MSYHPDFESDGEWEDRGDLVWNEYDWQRYLKQNEVEMARFVSLYKKMRHHPNRLDEIARMMGWDREDWNAGEIASSEDSTFEEDLDERMEMDDFDPYTVHRHPVYVVTHALYDVVLQAWDYLIKNTQARVSSTLILDFSNKLHQGQYQAIMAVNALDMGDFTLCVTHLKHALSELNTSLGLIQKLPLRQSRDCAMFHADALPILFDLRDLWLRVMNECREEHRRGFRGE